MSEPTPSSSASSIVAVSSTHVATADATATATAATAPVASSSATPASRSRTLIHFKKNSRHAVSQALAALRWNEVRLRIPKVGASTEEAKDADSDEDHVDESEEPADEVDSAALSVAAAAVSDVKSRARKVKQPKSLLINLDSYTAFHPATGQASSAANLKWDIAWMDVLSEEEYKSLTRVQRINQFPLMHRLTKKKYLALNLNRMREQEPHEYDFYPRSWVLPQELQQVKDYYAEIASSTAASASSDDATSAAADSTAAASSRLSSTPILIVKPDFACEGKGIYLVDRLAAIDLSIPLVVQQYVARPLLLQGKKLDLRLYVLVTSVQPLSLFLFDDGLTRFCTDEYVAPGVGALGSSFQHLTNYAINKKNVDKFVYNTDATQSDIGNKWSVKSLLQKLKSEGKDVDTLWSVEHASVRRSSL
jgi:hypothetical protein